MSLFKNRENLKVQIIETEHLLGMVSDHPIMSEGLTERLSQLRTKLDSLPDSVDQAKVQILFSGNAVLGSKGIKASFLSKTLKPFQEMVKTQAALVRYGAVGERGKAKKGPNAELYLTSLPTGSFGVELSQLESDELFEEEEVSNAMKKVIAFIQKSTESEEAFEEVISEAPKRMFGNLKKFLKEVSEENSIVKMECGEIGVQISKEDILTTYHRINDTINSDYPVTLMGVFRGILLDSGRFEVVDENGDKISGFISKELSEDELISYDQEYLNEQCTIHLQLHRTIFKSGKEKIEYELLEIQSV